METTTTILKRLELLEKISLLNGAFFTVEFTKKDGTKRIMNCRTGVKKYLVQNGRTIKTVAPSENGILRVFDLKAGQYRSINLDTVTKINYNKINLKYR